MDVEIGFHTAVAASSSSEVVSTVSCVLDMASYITSTSFAVDGGYLTV